MLILNGNEYRKLRKETEVITKASSHNQDEKTIIFAS